jgi:hypothetical protein
VRDFQTPGRSPVIATNGLAATSHPLATGVAIRLLQDGGNAVDAAIAAAVLLGICEPQMTGIGGDCFVLLKPPGEERVIALNGSGRAPAALSAADICGTWPCRGAHRGPEAVTIPGAIDAFCRLSADWGRIGLADTFSRRPSAMPRKACRSRRAWPSTGTVRRDAQGRRPRTTFCRARCRARARCSAPWAGGGSAPDRRRRSRRVLRRRGGRRHGARAARGGRGAHARRFRGHGLRLWRSGRGPTRGWNCSSIRPTGRAPRRS